MAAGEARRRTVRGACALGGAWAAVVLADVALVRTHVLAGAYTGISALAGAFAGALLLEVGIGRAEEAAVEVRDGRSLLSARTLTGVRTVDLDALAGVRRCEEALRGRHDEFRLRDRHGVRLAVPNGPSVDAALRRALGTAPDVRVTRHARTTLGLTPRSRVPAGLHAFWGTQMFVGAMAVPALLGHTVACLLAGTNVF
ncbi:MAG: hypothetical protein HOY69_39800 [Streptomyces sp.]|nr:hypothetical protein [Streptomyces sp.]